MAEIPPRLVEALRDRYRLERELGRGGMGAVYLAEDLKHHRKVAVKVLRPDLAASLGTDRFLREIEVAAQLQHPAILPLLDSGQADGYVFYIMPFVEGESLRDRLARAGRAAGGRGRADPVRGARRARLRPRQGRGPPRHQARQHHALRAVTRCCIDFGVAKALNASAGPPVRHDHRASRSARRATWRPSRRWRTGRWTTGPTSTPSAWWATRCWRGGRRSPGNTAQQIVVAQMTQAPEDLLSAPAVGAAARSPRSSCGRIERKPADRWQSAAEMLPGSSPTSERAGRPRPRRDPHPARPRRRARWLGLAIGVGRAAGGDRRRGAPAAAAHAAARARRPSAGDARPRAGDRAGDVARRAPGGLCGRVDECVGDPGAPAGGRRRARRGRPERAAPAVPVWSPRRHADHVRQPARASRSSPPWGGRRGWWCPTSTIPAGPVGQRRSAHAGGVVARRPTHRVRAPGHLAASGTWTGARSARWRRTVRCIPSPGRPTVGGSRACGGTASRVSPASCSATSVRPESGSSPWTGADSPSRSPTTSGSTPVRPGPRTAGCCSS